MQAAPLDANLHFTREQECGEAFNYAESGNPEEGKAGGTIAEFVPPLYADDLLPTKRNP